MKKLHKLLMFSLLMLFFVLSAQPGITQPPPPADQGSNSNKAPSGGGGAPIDGGLFVALAMVAGFGAWKLFKSRRWQGQN